MHQLRRLCANAFIVYAVVGLENLLEITYITQLFVYNIYHNVAGVLEVIQGSPKNVFHSYSHLCHQLTLPESIVYSLIVIQMGVFDMKRSGILIGSALIQ